MQQGSDGREFGCQQDEADEPEDDRKGVSGCNFVMVERFQDATEVLMSLIARIFGQRGAHTAGLTASRLQQREAEFVVGGGDAGKQGDRREQDRKRTAAASGAVARPLAPFGNVEAEEGDYTDRAPKYVERGIECHVEVSISWPDQTRPRSVVACGFLAVEGEERVTRTEALGLRAVKARVTARAFVGSRKESAL